MDELLGISQVARALGVSPARVRQLIDQGDLPAQRIGRIWIVDSDSVRQRSEVNIAHGRPYASRQVWRMGVLADLAAHDDEGAEFRRAVGPQAHWRLRHYLADLANEPDPPQVAWRLRGRSSDVLDRYAHPSVLARLVDDPRLVLSGAHAAVRHGSNLVPDAYVDAYVDRADVENVADDHGLIDSVGAVNVRLRVLDEPPDWWQSLQRADDVGSVAPRLLVLADLSERDEARARLAAAALWSSLRPHLLELAS